MSETFFHLLGPGTQPNDDSFSMNPLPITCQVNGEPSMAALEQCAHSPQVIALLNELQHQLSERQPPLGEVLAVDLLNLNADDRHFINTLLGEGEVSVRIQQADDSESEIQEAIFCGLWRVRRRCGLPDFEDSWALAGGIPSGQKLRKVLHQERSIEFLFEGRRFHDLRRWKEAPEVMNKQPRSWNRDAGRLLSGDPGRAGRPRARVRIAEELLAGHSAEPDQQESAAGAEPGLLKNRMITHIKW